MSDAGADGEGGSSFKIIIGLALLGVLGFLVWKEMRESGSEDDAVNAVIEAQRRRLRMTDEARWRAGDEQVFQVAQANGEVTMYKATAAEIRLARDLDHQGIGDRRHQDKVRARQRAEGEQMLGHERRVLAEVQHTSNKLQELQAQARNHADTQAAIQSASGRMALQRCADMAENENQVAQARKAALDEALAKKPAESEATAAPEPVKIPDVPSGLSMSDCMHLGSELEGVPLD